jgi:S-adenosylmethionine:tRNA ribosyltransferase-isomerase
MRMQDLHFDLPRSNMATMPPESRGEQPDRSRLLVIDRSAGAIEHTRFFHIGRYLRAGDLLVINNSATVPAALHGTLRSGESVAVHLMPPRASAPGEREAVLETAASVAVGTRIVFGGGALEATVAAQRPDVVALYRLRFRASNGTPTGDVIARLLQPIVYREYVEGDWDLRYYQTMFAKAPGSSEMPSAARHFTPDLVAALQAGGVEIAELTLHTGVSGVEIEEATAEEHAMYEEEYNLPIATADAINCAKREGRRVIAVGTTVTRTLETCANDDGTVTSGHGWTDLYIIPGFRFRAIDGLITGLHEARSTRLVLLTAFAGDAALVLRAYNEALIRGYRWHEWGDATLVV